MKKGEKNEKVCRFFLLCIFVISPIYSQLNKTNPYLVRTFIDKDGKQIDEIIVPGTPPKDFKAPIAYPSKAAVTISNVPAFSWSFGCSATSAAMIAGYYDRGIYPNMYTGATNGGVMPLDNSTWGTVVINGETRALCPLSATRQGLDGLATKGHVDDYWHSVDSIIDPYYGNWPEHGYADCTADFMGTNQYQNFGNVDGATTFYNYTDGSPLYNFDASYLGNKDGCYGFKQFFNSRGYEIFHDGSNYQNYSQYILGQGSNPSLGFTYNQYKAEINAGRPVMIQVEGHTMVGYGYDNASSTIYIHDTWDYNSHSMTWGGTYYGMQHYGVTVFILDTPTITVTSPNGGETWNLGSTYSITWNSQYISTVDIALLNSGSLVQYIAFGVNANTGNHSWSIPTGLMPSSNFSIRISDSNASSLYDTSNNYFSLQQQPTITISTHNGGETWQISTMRMINWMSTNVGPHVNIDLYSGGFFHSTIASNILNSGNYPWSILNSITAGNQYTVRIEDASNSTIFDYSNYYFTIINPPGYGIDDNSANPMLPVMVDVEPIDINGQMVDPNVMVDPFGSVALTVEVIVRGTPVHPVANPAMVAISYSLNLTGTTSGITMNTQVDFSGMAVSPNFVHFWNGSSWEVPSNIAWGGNSVLFDFTLNSKSASTEIILSNDNPLPVTLSSFTANYEFGNAYLKWTTQSELNNSHWNVYRSISENHGQSQKMNNNEIAGSGTVNEPTNYVYYDEAELIPEMSYWYWIECVDYSGNTELFAPVFITIPEEQITTPEIPFSYGLYANYPNPFNPSTQISFALNKAAHVNLTVYDVKGRIIRSILSGEMTPAEQVIRVTWDGKDETGKEVGSGVYFYRLKAGSKDYIRKMLLIK